MNMEKTPSQNHHDDKGTHEQHEHMMSNHEPPWTWKTEVQTLQRSKVPTTRKAPGRQGKDTKQQETKSKYKLHHGNN